METSEIIIAKTQEWLEKAVIGLNLCPFAKAVHIKNQIRYVVTPATSEEEVLQTLIRELQYLAQTSPSLVDTTLIIHPEVFPDFLDYNEFLAVAEGAVQAENLEGVIQIASFHPQYQFAGTEPQDNTNYTNRSPYPMLHLLRESSLTKVLETFPNPELIPEKNMETLNHLGIEGWKKLNIPEAGKNSIRPK